MNSYNPNNLFDAEVFTLRNLGPDCDLIGRLLYEFGDMFINSALEDGEYGVEVGYYHQMLDPLCAHFILKSTGVGSMAFIVRTTPCRISGTPLFPISVQGLCLGMPWPNWKSAFRRQSGQKPIRTMAFIQ